ncbi:MAG: Chaperone protein DnaK [Planctomycetes bacterium ADurb.Bin126]|nr:MAG: Chaperone protein DnaK [Planctomycetes bacterium ADurb.Bin126]
MPRIVGIDLGTTNSIVAVMDRNGPVVIPNSSGERLTASVVGFTKSGEILVGKKARRAAVMNVGRTVFSIKRHMGTTYRVRIDGREYTPQEISGMILQKLKQDTEDFFGEEVSQAVITVPAYFTDAQRQATKDAGEIAGFNVRRVIDEPTAAAMAYGLDKSKDQTIIVYDLGGGTFDVSIIEVMSGVFRVMAIHGDTQLGGDDFDKRIMDFLVEEFKKEHGVNLEDDPVAMMRLRDAAEEAKIDLSEMTETHILVEAITMGDKGPLTLDVQLKRAQFESMIRDLVERTIEPMQSAIKDAGLSRDQIDTVLLVGGSTRIPLVQNIVKQTLGKNPNRDISPDEVVALGAAVQTLVLAPVEGDLEDSLATHYGKEKPVIIHMTPFSLGVALQSDQFAPIIERNSTYPTEAKDIFTTTRDFQEAISFPIYEGEEPIASENTFLDLLRIEGITPAPRGVPRIEVTFRLNADRILEARAEDLATGLEKTITIASTGSRLSDAEKNRMVREARERIAQTLRERIKSNVREEATDAIRRGQELIAHDPGNPRAQQVRQLISTVERGIQSGDDDNLERYTTELIQLVNELEAASA